jgi:methyl-accepting chemotaxis protein
MSSQEAATDGEKAVKEMIQAIDEINESNSAIMAEIDRGNKRISEIVEVITEISQKTKVINDIVFQTKLLSFNASVEAAKAGEHGKGFAVVAEEIGNLAQMSGKASKEIAEMLNASIQRVNGIVRDTSEKVQSFVKSGKTKVEAGTVVANRCGDVLTEVVKNVKEVSRMISNISLAAKDQAQGMNEIANAMLQLDTVTNQNTSVVNDTANYSSQLSTQSETLRTTLRELARNVLLLSADSVGSERDLKSDEARGGKVIGLDRHVRKKIQRKNRYQTVEYEIPSEEDSEFEDV